MRARNLSHQTVRAYRTTLTAFALWCHDRNRLFRTVTYRDIQDWLESCDLAPKSSYTYTSRLASLYQWLIREEYLEHDPTVRVDRPKLGRGLPRPAETETVRQAMNDADPRAAAMIALGSFCGMRRFEIAELRVEDLFLRRDPPVIVVHGKGSRDRLLALNEEVLIALRRHGLPSAGYVFPGRSNGHLSAHTVGNLIADALSLSADGRVTTHQLRHWFASEVYAATHDLRLTQEVLGHASPATTAVYAAFSNTDAQRAVTGLSLAAEEESQTA